MKMTRVPEGSHGPGELLFATEWAVFFATDEQKGPSFSPRMNQKGPFFFATDEHG